MSYLMFTFFWQCICIIRHTCAIIHHGHSGDVEKSDEKQETQSKENAENSFNFEHTEGGLNLFLSASFKHI